MQWNNNILLSRLIQWLSTSVPVHDSDSGQCRGSSMVPGSGQCHVLTSGHYTMTILSTDLQNNYQQWPLKIIFRPPVPVQRWYFKIKCNHWPQIKFILQTSKWDISDGNHVKMRHSRPESAARVASSLCRLEIPEWYRSSRWQNCQITLAICHETCGSPKLKYN